MRARLIICGILFLAVVVCLPFLSGSFWMDEAAQALESIRPLSQQLQIAKDFQPPLYHLLVHVVIQFGREEWWLRMASVIPAVGTVWFTFLLGKELTQDKKKKHGVGYLAALLLALSAFHIFYAQELRQYALAEFFGVVSWYALMRSLREQQEKKWQLLLIGATVGGLYTMYVYPFLTLLQFAYVVCMHRKQTFIMLKLLGVAGICFLPWVPGFLGQLKVGTTLQQALPGWSQVVGSPQWKALPLVWLKLLGGGKGIDLSPADAVYFGAPTMLLLVLWWKQRKTINPVVWFWLAAAGAAWVVSFIIPVIQPKRVLFILPAFYLAFAQGVVALKLDKIRNLFVVAAIAYQLLGLSILWTTPSLQREDWRSAIEGIHRNYSTSDTVVVFGFTEPFAPWTWYERTAQPPFATVAFPQIYLSKPEDVETSLQKTLIYRRVLVFDYLRDLTDPHRLIEAWLESHGYTGTASLDTKNMGFVRVYEKAQFLSLQ